MKKLISLAVVSALTISLPVVACNEDSKESMNKVNFTASKITIKSMVKPTSIFTVEGMTCDSCTKKVGKAISRVKGVKSVKVDLKTEKATIVLDSKANSKTVSEAIKKAVADSGYKATKI